MSKVTELASSRIAATDTITVELVEPTKHLQWSSFGGRLSPPSSIRDGSRVLPCGCTSLRYRCREAGPDKT